MSDEARPPMGIVVSALTVPTQLSFMDYISQTAQVRLSKSVCQSHSMTIEFLTTQGVCGPLSL